jgi:hypothetical protein
MTTKTKPIASARPKQRRVEPWPTTEMEVTSGPWRVHVHIAPGGAVTVTREVIDSELRSVLAEWARRTATARIPWLICP